MIKTKKGAGAAAGLIAIIAVIIVVYLLLIPTSYREQLLNETSGTSTTTTSKVLGESILVFEHPGTLDPLQNQDREKILDSFSLYTEKNAVVLDSVISMHVEKGWFTDKAYNLTFDVTDVANTENLVLAFDTETAIGRLIITLNGKEIYNSFAPVGNAVPIELSKKDITERNSLIFSASNVGAAFWRLNEYNLKNVRVIADFTDISKREYKNTFLISATEKENFEKTKLTFVPDCLTRTVGPLKISINDRELPYSAIPDCGLLSTVEFDPNYLKQGENSITFRAEEGNYFIDRVSIKSELKEMNYPFYYFEIESDDYKKILNKTANVTLDIKFADKDEKTGELNVNGHLSRLETENATFSEVISRWTQEDQNYLQIRPITILNIVDLKVSLNK